MTTKISALDQARGDDWQLFRGDCVEVMQQLPPASIDFAVYSPPFSNLYCYGDSDRDMGNSLDDAQFLAHYRFMVDELLDRKSTRLNSSHTVISYAVFCLK